MAKRMLIDATHPEETRVVVVNGTRLEQLDVETSTKKQLKGNIYLAKVIRVEPSLQAAFVDYGGNRHGFLAFSEIHPDYYQIPVADRQALLDAQEQDEDDNGDNEGDVETLGGDDPEDVRPRTRSRSARDYKIQEVIKRRQIMLVQVVKEERGNKGAALTTYLSLAGRYCVLMPNTARGGGVSRKITNAADRKRLKTIMGELDIPSIMAVIVRTAGMERSKAEIKRDYEYLMRTWNQIRETTMDSRAPCLIYEEGNLIKRAIRDVYSSDIEEVLVEGEEGYRLAKDFMKILTPSHAKKVQPYRDQTMPLFHRYQVDSQLDAMHSPTVQLKSGGYIVINQTEALVAIDVNSGRATKERHIEETALKTNLEAADEVARQLRLRDLAGLIVIDFIDMEENKNNSAVERRLKDALKQDRARIQMGRISPFGLMEMSRQRLRPSLMETSFETCPHCGGAGMVRSVESAAVHILRVIEEEGVRRRSSEITLHVASPVALYILNNKRRALAEIEGRYEFSVMLLGDDSLIPPDYRMDRVKAETAPDLPREPEVIEAPVEPEVSVQAEDEDSDAANADGKRRRKRRKRRRRNGAEDMAAEQTAGMPASDSGEDADSEEDEDESTGQAEAAETEGDGDGREDGKRRRRSRRGGRRRRRSSEGDGTSDQSAQATEAQDGDEAPALTETAEGDAPAAEADEDSSAAEPSTDVSVDQAASDAPKRPRRRVRRAKTAEESEKVATIAAEPAPESPVADETAPASETPAAEVQSDTQTAEAPQPRRRSRRRKPEPDAVVDTPAEAQAEAQPDAPVAAEAEAEAMAEADAPMPVTEDAAPQTDAEPAPEPAAPDVQAEAAPEEVAAPEEPMIEDKPVQVEGAQPDTMPRRRGWWQKLMP